MAANLTWLTAKAKTLTVLFLGYIQSRRVQNDLCVQLKEWAWQTNVQSYQAIVLNCAYQSE